MFKTEFGQFPRRCHLRNHILRDEIRNANALILFSKVLQKYYGSIFVVGTLITVLIGHKIMKWFKKLRVIDDIPFE